MGPQNHQHLSPHPWRYSSAINAPLVEICRSEQESWLTVELSERKSLYARIMIDVSALIYSSNMLNYKLHFIGNSNSIRRAMQWFEMQASKKKMQWFILFCFILVNSELNHTVYWLVVFQTELWLKYLRSNLSNASLEIFIILERCCWAN